MANEVLFWHGEKVSALAAGRELAMDAVSGFRNAVNTLTGDGTNVSDGDIVTIDGVVYTFQTALTEAAGHVLIGASAAASLTNLFHAINKSGGTAGTDYANACVAHPTVLATNPSGTTVVATAQVAGSAADAIATTEASTHLSWGTATLTGGLDGDVLTDPISGFPKYATYALVTIAGTANDYALPIGDEGQEVTIYLKTKGAGANAVVTGAFVGGTTLTLDTAGKLAKLKFLNASWAPMANTGTIA